MSERDEYLLRGDDAELVVARARLARRQADLLAALVAGGPVPAGFDPRQVAAQAAALAAKRRDTAARVAPDLARLLGTDWRPLFDRYARLGPQRGGYREDARAFAAWALAAEPSAPWRADLAALLSPAPVRPVRRALRAVRAAAGRAERVHPQVRARTGDSR